MSCERVVELLPWYLNGTLGGEEAGAVAEHLAACGDCRAELEATARMAWISQRHVPARLVTEYAFGSELERTERALVERHLAHCEQCREELRVAQEVAALRIEGAAPGNRGARWLLALAASLVILLLGGFWWSSTFLTTPSPEGNVALLELVPESLATRGASQTPIPARGPVTVVLVTDLVLEGEDYRARLLGPDDEEIWRVENLRPERDGAFVLHLPEGFTPSAGSVILLESREGENWSALERYPISG